MPIPAKLFLTAGGLLVAGLAIYKSYHEFRWEYILFAIVGLSIFFMGLDPFTLKRPYLLINDSKIEYKIRKMGQPWVVKFDEIDSIKIDNKRLRINFYLADASRKTLFLRLFPEDIRSEMIDTINQVSAGRRK
jgi:hypothetical protein